MTTTQARLRRLNAVPVAKNGHYVLYWMQAARRLRHNHALDYALRCAGELGRPIVIYEGLRSDYFWASRRLHRFVLEGMRDNAEEAREREIDYWPFVATPENPGRGLLKRLAGRACLVVTDDFPGFIVPDQSAALARAGVAAVFAVDSNGVVPLAMLGEPTSAAVHMRRRIHRLFADAWGERSQAEPELHAAARGSVEPPFEPWDPGDLEKIASAEWLDASVPVVPKTPGGPREARRRLATFLERGLKGYAEKRSQPTAPAAAHASGLSPYLHFGHIAAEEVVEAALSASPGWDTAELRLELAGRRQGFFGADADVESFLDETITWRDLGYHWHRHRRNDTATLQAALPGWALDTLRVHASDEREPSYPLEALEAGETADPLWNAAQRELVVTGTIHNYLRMLWGKKVLEWAPSPEQAYQALVHLNNKYALDGRDPNSWTGILWCFGLFDRAWGPERKVFGKVRYMSSQNTARKFKLAGYFDYVESLPPVSAVGRESRP